MAYAGGGLIIYHLVIYHLLFRFDCILATASAGSRGKVVSEVVGRYRLHLATASTGSRNKVDSEAVGRQVAGTRLDAKPSGDIDCI